jgi:hypothetical protein
VALTPSHGARVSRARGIEKAYCTAPAASGPTYVRYTSFTCVALFGRSTRSTATRYRSSLVIPDDVTVTWSTNESGRAAGADPDVVAVVAALAVADIERRPRGACGQVRSRARPPAQAAGGEVTALTAGRQRGQARPERLVGGDQLVGQVGVVAGDVDPRHGVIDRRAGRLRGRQVQLDRVAQCRQGPLGVARWALDAPGVLDPGVGHLRAACGLQRLQDRQPRRGAAFVGVQAVFELVGVPVLWLHARVGGVSLGAEAAAVAGHRRLGRLLPGPPAGLLDEQPGQRLLEVDLDGEDEVPVTAAADGRERGQQRLDTVPPARGCQRQQPLEQLDGGLDVLVGPVAPLVGDPEVGAAVHQAERGDVQGEPVRQPQRADHSELRHGQAGSLVLGGEERHVEWCVVGDEHAAAKQPGKPRCDVGEAGLARQVDAAGLRAAGGPGVQQRRPALDDGGVVQDRNGDPDHAVAAGDRPGRLGVEDHIARHGHLGPVAWPPARMD